MTVWLCPVDGGRLCLIALRAKGVDWLVEPTRIVAEQRGYECDRCGHVFTTEEVLLLVSARSIEVVR